jgi:aminoglycoside 6-adenylyltransferase
VRVEHAAVLRNVVLWAAGDENVRAVVLEGSLARDDGSVDDYSDLDIRLYVDEPELLLHSREWFEQFGDVLVVEALANPGWYPTRLVYYVDGKIDFLIAPTSSLANRERFGRRVRVLVDKDRLTATIAQGDAAAPSLPDEESYLICVHEFYAAALMYARMLVRGEPIKAKFRDWDMKTRLFAMIEWDHIARFGRDRNVQPLGAHFREWADADVLDHLDRCWSAGLAPSRDALSSTVSLFTMASERVAREVALPEFDAAAVIGEIERIATARS